MRSGFSVGVRNLVVMVRMRLWGRAFSLKVFTNGSPRLVLGASMHAKLIKDTRWPSSVVNWGRLIGCRGSTGQR